MEEKSRRASVKRVTKETDISMDFEIDGEGISHIDTGIGFFNHMLEGFTRHGFFNLDVIIKGDLEVDGHHTVEDAGIVLGNAIKEAVGDKKGIKRYGYFILPMDDALVLCAVDLCGRPYLQFDCEFKNEMVGDFDMGIKLDRSGSLKLKMFSHSSDDYTSFLDNSQRNGVGLSYQKEYDNLADYLRSLIKKNSTPVISEEPVKTLEITQ